MARSLVVLFQKSKANAGCVRCSPSTQIYPGGAYRLFLHNVG